MRSPGIDRSRRRGLAGFAAVAGLVLASALAPARAADDDRAEAFFHAIAVDDAGELASLLARGASPDLRDARGQVALYVALRDGSPKCARVLAAAPKLTVDAVNAFDETPLMMAALRGDEEVVRTLLARGAAAHRPGWSPLHYAAAGGHPALVRLFLSLGAPVDARAADGTTPLMMAAAHGGSETAEVLLEAGADRSLVDARGRDAAARADAAGSDAVATWLREWKPASQRARPVRR